MIDRIIEVYNLLQGSAERRHWIFAYVIVPGLVTSYMVSGLSTVSPFNGFEDTIAVAPIRTVDDRSGKLRDQDGIVLIADPSDLEFSIPWRHPGGKVSSLFLSIDSASYQSNFSRLALDDNSLRAKLPLLGVSDPFVLIAVGGAADDVLLPGKSLTADAFKLPSRSSTALALWGVLACMFGIGLSIGMANAPVAEPKKD